MVVHFFVCALFYSLGGLRWGHSGWAVFVKLCLLSFVIVLHWIIFNLSLIVTKYVSPLMQVHKSQPGHIEKCACKLSFNAIFNLYNLCCTLYLYISLRYFPVSTLYLYMISLGLFMYLFIYYYYRYYYHYYFRNVGRIISTIASTSS